MRQYFLSFVLSFSAFALHAQSDPVGDFNRHLLANWNGSYHRISQYRVKGTPFLFGQSFPGSIDLNGGKRVTGVNILYDLYAQTSGIDMKNTEMFEAAEGVTRFTVDLPVQYGGETLIFVNANEYTSDYKGYFNLLADGEKVALLKAFKLKLLLDQTNQMARDVRVAEQYYGYYLFDKVTKKLQKIKLKEKDLLTATPDQAAAKRYLKANNLNVTKEEDAISFVAGYYSKTK